MKEKLAKAFEIEFHYTEVGFKNETDSKRKPKSSGMRASVVWVR